MANQEHLDILAKGVEAWNAWRDETPVVPDLSEANLPRAKLSGADLSRAILSRANLTEADLSYAKLFGADLSYAKPSGANLFGANLSYAKLSYAKLSAANLFGANLSFANLFEADLSYAKLPGADLSGADLSEADLTGTDLTGADLTGAQFNSASLRYTVFANVDLSAAKDLDKAKHDAPSSIGIDTIYRSKSNIPESFLRGAGVPDSFIAYMHSLTGAAFEFYSCFISYSSKDEKFAKRLYADLQAQGVRCWYAPEDMKTGDRLRVRIDESIRLHEKLLLVLSATSVTSAWVEQEVETAIAREKPGASAVLFPIRIDKAVTEIETGWPALIKRTRHIGDFTGWKVHDSYQKALDRLVRDLKVEAKDKATA